MTRCLRAPRAEGMLHPASPMYQEAALQDPGADRGRFFELAQDLCWVFDEESYLVLANPSTRRVLGYRPEDLVGARFPEITHPDESEAVRSGFHALVAGTGAAWLDCRIRHAEGRWVQTHWNLHPDPEAGRVYGVGRSRLDELRRRREDRSRVEADLRLRTAGELHDGVLQTLTAAGLQLEVARRMLDTDTDAARTTIERLAESLAAEQRELRLFVDEVGVEEPIWSGQRTPLPRRIAEMLDRIQAIWGVGTSLDISVDGAPVDPEAERQVLRLVQEAVVNAVRHGGARRVNVSVRIEEGVALLDLVDDGHGFPFKGVYDDAALKRERLGPVSLKRRVRQSGGSIDIESTPQGASVHIRLPTSLAAEADGGTGAGTTNPGGGG